MMEPGKITLSLPSFDKSFFKSGRFLWGVASIAAIASLSYWYLAIHPYLVVNEGVVSPFLVPLKNSVEGVTLSELRAEVGEWVERGKWLASFKGTYSEGEKLSVKIASLEREIEVEKGRKEKAMHEYLLAGPDVDLIRGHIGLLEESQRRVEELTQELFAARSQVDLLDQKKGEGNLYAPFDGVVVERRKEVGDKVGAEEVVYTLFDPARTWVEARLSEKELGKISLGALAHITLPAYPHREWRGKVSWIAPVATLEGGERFVVIRVTLTTSDPLVKPGLSAKLRLKTSS